MQPRLSVSEATELIRSCIEDGLTPFWVEGEVSNFIAHSSGHFYFSLKDADAQLRCVMFRGANRRLRFMPENGLTCAGFGRIGLYARSGQYQLIVERLLPAGEGELQLAFEALKAKLDAEGLFAPERKQRLPGYPTRIGLVTSPTGAAVRDILRVLRRRWPSIQIVLRPTRVQGEGAAGEIAGAIAALEAYGEVDLLIVGRGGGSAEDLWAFNEEITVRAIAGCRIPIISAVGHETDMTLADLAADLRAPTPSAAAELAVRDYRETVAELRSVLGRAGRALHHHLERRVMRLAAIRRSRALLSPVDRLQQEAQRVDELWMRCTRAMDVRLARERAALAAVQRRLSALNPEGILQRGYAVAYGPQGRVLGSAGDVEPGEQIRVQLGRGALECRVLSRRGVEADDGDS
jgi:exodeoxyribonuclease VII large subunit